MLEKIYNKIISENIINKIKKNHKHKKLFILAIFLLNLSLYSIPLLLFHLEIIKISQNILNLYTKFLYDFEILKIEKILYDNTIVVKEIHFYVDQQCLGLKSILGLFSIIFATPIKSLRKRILYFLIYSPIIFFANLIRIYSTIYLFYFFNVNPYLVHDILWEVLNLFLILGIWFKFYKKTKNELILTS
ncbi:MAG: exosortase/archaeosortase family protein [Nanopusillaceae archaeon]